MSVPQYSSVPRKLWTLALVLWAGSLWSLAVWVAPTLFLAQTDRRLAGILAGTLFSIETYLGLAVALAALMLPGGKKFGLGFAAVALLAVNEWVLKPLLSLAHVQGTAAGLSFGAWHGVSAVLYVAACLEVLLLVWNEDFR